MNDSRPVVLHTVYVVFFFFFKVTQIVFFQMRPGPCLYCKQFQNRSWLSVGYACMGVCWGKRLELQGVKSLAAKYGLGMACYIFAFLSIPFDSVFFEIPKFSYNYSTIQACNIATHFPVTFSYFPDIALNRQVPYSSVCAYSSRCCENKAASWAQQEANSREQFVYFWVLPGVEHEGHLSERGARCGIISE